MFGYLYIIFTIWDAIQAAVEVAYMSSFGSAELSYSLQM